MTLRVGSPVYSCASGLGILAKSFYDNGIVTDPFLIGHAHHEDNPGWYAPGTPGAHIKDLGRPDVRRRMEEWCRSLDVFLALETPFVHELLPFCKRHGVKTVLCVMHECWHHAIPTPDQIWAPSLLDFQVAAKCDVEFSQQILPFCAYMGVVFTPVPVAIEWRQRDRARVFVFNNGNGGLRGRNGLDEFLDAVTNYVKSPARVIVRSQKPIDPKKTCNIRTVETWGAHERVGPTIEVRTGTAPYDELWTEGDVMVFPEKFNGLSLPIQEARAAGMLVMAGARFPNTTYIPPEPLIPVKEYRRTRVGGAYPEFDEAVFDPRAIAATIDKYYDADITDYSRSGREWAELMSWAALGPKYQKLLHELTGK